MKKLLLTVLFLYSTFLFAQQTFQVSGIAFYDVNNTGSYQMEVDSTAWSKHIEIKNLQSLEVLDIQTDGGGRYSISLPVGHYSITYVDTYDQVNFSYAGSTEVIYVDFRDNSKTVDIVFTPYHQPPTYLGAGLYRDNYEPLSPQGDNRRFTLKYGYLDRTITSMPATITLDFDPLLSLAQSSLPPSLITPGHVEWNLGNVTGAMDDPFSNEGDTIGCSFNFPAVGDTVSELTILPAFRPGIQLTKMDSTLYNELYYNRVDFPERPARGISNGVKWMRNNNYSYWFAFQSYPSCSVDTTYADDGYFVGDTRYYYDSTSNEKSNCLVSKIDKSGLTVWEQKVEGSLFGSNESLSIITIKSSNDGGCFLFAHLYLFNDTINKTAIVKLDAKGNISWIKAINNHKKQYLFDAAILTDGILLTGADYNKYGYPETLVVMKLSIAGDLIWTKQYGGSNVDVGLKVMVLKNNSYLILGATGSNDGDVRGSHQHEIMDIYENDTLNKSEAWILNINSNGEIIWNKCYGGSDIGLFISGVETGNNILLAGYTASKNGDLPYYTEMGIPLWLLRINTSNGNIVWNKTYKFYNGYKHSDYISPEFVIDYGPFFYNISQTKDGNFVLGGSMTDNYGAIKSLHGKSDFIFLKVNSTGDIIWQKSIGGGGNDYLSDCIKDKNDDIVFAGMSYSVNDDLYGIRKKSDVDAIRVIGKVGITNVIKGQVFVDNNNNGIKDAAESFYSNGRIQSAKIKDTITGYIFNGQFLNNIDTGNYVTTYLPANNYYTVSPASHNTSFIALDQIDAVNFALKPKPNVNDLEIQMIPLAPARPGFEVQYRIITKNVGTTTISNAVVALKKDRRQTFTAASRPYSGVAGDSLWWGPVTLNAFDIDTIDVTLTNAVPPGVNNGDTISLAATANPVVNDSSISNNTYVVKQIVTGSFDPNDKTEIHGGLLTPVAYTNNEYLQYLIRFQNTGTDTAFFVTVKDTFDTKFDLSTVDVMAASNTYNFRLEKNVATWDFKFIKLVDSATNEKESHGYILFRVKPKKGLSIGEVFNNKAAIYFDYNLPVITNTEKTFLNDGTSVCPGTNVRFTSSVSGNTYQWQVNNGSGYVNVLNNTAYSGSNTASLQITAAPSSLYGFKYRCLVNGSTYSAESQIKFLVKWTGASSTDWHNAANWSCGVIPDANMDVQIKTGTTNAPVINASAVCRSINAAPGATLLIKSGVQLSITGK